MNSLSSDRPNFIAGDWGTSRLRLLLCDSAGRVLDRAEGPGIGKLNKSAEEVFAAMVKSWPAVPAVLCGMAGSSIGWRETPYLSCPADMTALAEGCLRFRAADRDIALTPGLACDNPLGAPDRLRGEETQIFGALIDDVALTRGRHLFCLPGTHTKWAMLEDGKVQQFLTALTGEAFDLLRRHSILVRTAENSEIRSSPAYEQGVRQASLHPEADLLHHLFAARSRQLSGQFSADEAAEHLSGLVIGRDIAGALSLFPATKVLIVGGAGLAQLYEAALQQAGVSATLLDGEQAALAGLAALHRRLFALESLHGA